MRPWSSRFGEETVHWFAGLPLTLVSRAYRRVGGCPAMEAASMRGNDNMPRLVLMTALCAAQRLVMAHPGGAQRRGLPQSPQDGQPPKPPCRLEFRKSGWESMPSPERSDICRWGERAMGLHQELQRQVPRRVPQRALIPDAAAGQGDHHTLLARLQRGAPAQQHRPVLLARFAEQPAGMPALLIKPQQLTRSCNLQPGLLRKYWYGGGGRSRAGY